MSNQVRHERTGEDQQERDVQQHDDRALPAAAQQVSHAGDGRHRPEGEEYGMMVHRLRCRVGAVELLDHRTGHHHPDDGRHGAVAEYLQNLRLHQ